MEAAAGVAEAVLACRELAEVARCLGHGVVVELEDDAPGRLRADCNIKLRAPVSCVQLTMRNACVRRRC
jgi:hypothetical protein